MSDAAHEAATVPSPETMAENIERLQRYGRTVLWTHTPDLPSVRYFDAFPGATNVDPLGVITHFRLGEDVACVTLNPGTESEVSLSLAAVHRATIDHPLGRYMPLQGNLVPMPGLERSSGVPLLRWRSHFTEFGYHERAESSIHPDHPGVGVVRTYEARGLGRENKPSLEEAKQANKNAMTYLLSRLDGHSLLGDNGVVVTSRMLQQGETPVRVTRPRYSNQGLPFYEVDMLDVDITTSDDDLLARHLGRIKHYQLMPRHLDQITVDELYLYITHD